MIEALVKHIQDADFQVSILPHALLIWKIIDGTRYNKTWHTSPEEINQIRDESILFREADRIMALIENAPKVQVQIDV